MNFTVSRPQNLDELKSGISEANGTLMEINVPNLNKAEVYLSVREYLKDKERNVYVDLLGIIPEGLFPIGKMDRTFASSSSYFGTLMGRGEMNNQSTFPFFETVDRFWAELNPHEIEVLGEQENCEVLSMKLQYFHRQNFLGLGLGRLLTATMLHIHTSHEINKFKVSHILSLEAQGLWKGWAGIPKKERCYMGGKDIDLATERVGNRINEVLTSFILLS